MPQINISGAGLVGSLMALLSRKAGFDVTVFEKRKDLRLDDLYSGRSINLALSNRGLRALQAAGIAEMVLSEAIPMYGRMIHTPEQENTFQAYSHKNECIYSISRSVLNRILITEAEKIGVNFLFENTVDFSQIRQEELCFIAEGIHSSSRKNIPNHNTEEFALDFGYKEFRIEPKNGDFKIKDNALHIWPNKSHMFIALPNKDKSFTCTLFLANSGENSFGNLNTDSEITTFFKRFYPEISTLIPDYIQQFKNHPTSDLHYIKVEKWFHENTLLIGDSAHAIVPFYGQGMNAGFEDCSVLFELLKTKSPSLYEDFQSKRKENTDAICELALQNFIEMRDKVIDEDYLEMRKIEDYIISEYGTYWLTQYEMVTFSELLYKTALEKGKKQKIFLKSLIGKSEFEIREKTTHYLKNNI